jgi:hypothetical protein
LDRLQGSLGFALSKKNKLDPFGRKSSMRKFVITALAVAIALVGVVLIEGKPRAHACKAGGDTPWTETGNGTTGGGGGGVALRTTQMSGATFGGKDTANGD